MRIQPSASGQAETSIESRANPQANSLAARFERFSAQIFIWPAVIVLLCLSIFPLIISLYISMSRIRFVRGGLDLNFVGFANYRKQLLGSEQRQLLGVLERPNPVGWLIFAATAALLIWLVVRYVQGRKITAGGLIGRALFVVGSLGLSWLFVSTVTSDGRPGTLMVTLIYVFVGIFFQFFLGLGLALLAAQQLPGRRFFRIVFLLPMMITPVGVAYMFRMLADTNKGPLEPIWDAVGLRDYSWVDNPWSARGAILIGDIWQWTPFVFIVLLAAIEAQPVDPVEAATVDGASRWQIFRYVTWPAILPASATIVLIRMIEAFKIVDLPQVLTSGGPGTATRSLTLQAFINWKAVDLGGSAAVAYILLIVSTFICVAYANFVHKRAVS